MSAGVGRRPLITGLFAALATPAIIRPGLLMPVRSLTPVADFVERTINRGDALPPILYVLERRIELRGIVWSHGIGRVIVCASSNTRIRGNGRGGVDFVAIPDGGALEVIHYRRGRLMLAESLAANPGVA